jgi:hypothetical protein
VKMHPPTKRAVCHVCGFAWAVRGGKFANHNRMWRGKNVVCAGSRSAPEPDEVDEAFGVARTQPPREGDEGER